jgi:hypothetical protein
LCLETLLISTSRKFKLRKFAFKEKQKCDRF